MFLKIGYCNITETKSKPVKVLLGTKRNHAVAR